jgi:hypothetical protein
MHPTKRVTLLHSRERLLPKFDEGMHTEIVYSLEETGVSVVLGERLDLASLDEGLEKDGMKVVKTMTGREIAADLVVRSITFFICASATKYNTTAPMYWPTTQHVFTSCHGPM